VSKPSKTIVPPQDAEQLSAWLRTLLTRDRDLSKAERTAITELGQAAVPGLIGVLTDQELSMEASPGEGRAPGRAARLLSDLQAEEAVAPMVAVLLACDSMDVLYNEVSRALQEMGQPTVEPLLAALPAATESQRIAVCEVLAHLEVLDPRIFSALTSLLEVNVELGASFLATYGDEAALPFLLRSLDAYELRRADVGVLGDHAIIELAAAIKDLGGTFTESQQRKLRREETWRDEARQEVIAKHRPAPGDPGGRTKPGRNDPCWCGSDRKYKKCHLASDEQAPS
jgi:hypothetical protein